MDTVRVIEYGKKEDREDHPENWHTVDISEFKPKLTKQGTFVKYQRNIIIKAIFDSMDNPNKKFIIEKGKFGR